MPCTFYVLAACYIFCGTVLYTPTKGKPFEIKEKRRNKIMWSDGIIANPTTGTNYKYWVKHYEEGSEYGINGGKISKLTICKHGSTQNLVNYDRGWDVRPTDAEVNAVYEIVLAKYN
jgi:hypothetical protein